MRSPPRLRLLLVEYDPELRDRLSALIGKAGHEVTRSGDGAEALAIAGSSQFDLVISDVHPPQVDGRVLLAALKEHSPGTQVVLIATHANVSDAVKAVKAGARDYLGKPLDIDQLLNLVEALAGERALRGELDQARVDLEQLIRGPTTMGVGRSREMARALSRLETVARSHAPVLISGESGTGKELTARAIHDRSPRSGAPFVVVNCAALPEGLIEAELFGCEAGAFTGAEIRRDGRFKAAHRGTIFLDEVAEMPLSMQVKLLRVLQEGTIEPLGSDESIPVDVRVISATHRNLVERTSQGLFREDLFYRLNVLDLELPALRERKGDLASLLQYFVRKFTPEGMEQPGISARALKAMADYAFPGNVRELSHAIQRAVVLASGKEIDLEHLPPDIGGGDSMPTETPVLGTLGEAVGQFEKEYIDRALAESGDRRIAAAALLGISRKNLWEKIRLYGIGNVTIEGAS